MPRLNRELIRGWLEEHNWPVARLAAECSALGDDLFTEGTVRNVVNGIDPMRPGRIRVICKVTAKYGNGLTYEELVDDEQSSLRAARTAEITSSASRKGRNRYDDRAECE